MTPNYKEAKELTLTSINFMEAVNKWINSIVVLLYLPLISFKRGDN
jgi:hypothetical protein